MNIPKLDIDKIKYPITPHSWCECSCACCEKSRARPASRKL